MSNYDPLEEALKEEWFLQQKQYQQEQQAEIALLEEWWNYDGRSV